MPKIRKPYDKSEGVQTFTVGETRTKQAFRDECNINNIMRQYEKTGLLTHVRAHGGRYEDLPSDIDYQSALNTLIAAREAFDSLPSRIRSRFDNDPEEFLRFVQDPENHDELVELGLAPRTTTGEQPPAPAPAEPPAPQEAPASS